jgi:hypothetical protein
MRRGVLRLRAVSDGSAATRRPQPVATDCKFCQTTHNTANCRNIGNVKTTLNTIHQMPDNMPKCPICRSSTNVTYFPQSDSFVFACHKFFSPLQCKGKVNATPAHTHDKQLVELLSWATFPNFGCRYNIQWKLALRVRRQQRFAKQ